VKNIVLSLAIALALAGSAFAQQKIAYVNSTKIFDELPEARAAAKSLESFAKPVQDSLQMMQKQLEDQVAEYQKGEAMMTDAGKRAKQQSLQELQQRAREYAQIKDQELARQREKLYTPIKEKILKAIDRIAKAEKYSFVLDQNENVNIVLYADPSNDLTNRVLDNLKRGK
jgi:outer membrane protein